MGNKIDWLVLHLHVAVGLKKVLEKIKVEEKVEETEEWDHASEMKVIGRQKNTLIM